MSADDACVCQKTDPDGCCYHEHGRCDRPVAWTVKIDGKSHRMCDRHVRPEFYPRDLRKDLPGRLTKLVRAIVQPSYGGRA